MRTEELLGEQTGVQRVVLCTADENLAERIADALSSAGHEPAGRCSETAELVELFPLFDATLAVVVVSRASEIGQLVALRRMLPEVPLVAVVPGLSPADSRRLLLSDVDAVVHEDEIERALGPAIALALTDQLCVPSVARVALAGPVFSHREKQVLKLLLDGLTNSEIAGRLYLSESTVKSHLSSSFRKLGVSSRAEIRSRAGSPDPRIAVPLSLD